MANQSKQVGGIVPSHILSSKLLEALPVEIRLQIYDDVFRGSRVTVQRIDQPTPGSKRLELRPSHHYQLLLVCRQIYAEALSAYWSSTVMDSAMNPPLDFDNFPEVLRTTPVFARPLVREICCKGFREVPGLDINQFAGRFARLERLVMEPGFHVIPRIFYQRCTWSAGMVIDQAQRGLRMHYPSFGPNGLANIRGDIQVLQRVEGLRVRLAANDETWPAKVCLQSVSVTVRWNIADLLAP